MLLKKNWVTVWLLQKIHNLMRTIISTKSTSKLSLRTTTSNMMALVFSVVESQAQPSQYRISNPNTQHKAPWFQRNQIELCLETKQTSPNSKKNLPLTAIREYTSKESNFNTILFQSRIQSIWLRKWKKLMNSLKVNQKKVMVSFSTWRIHKGLIIRIWTQQCRAIQRANLTIPFICHNRHKMIQKLKIKRKLYQITPHRLRLIGELLVAIQKYLFILTPKTNKIYR